MKKLSLIFTILMVSLLMSFSALAEVVIGSGPDSGFLDYFASAWETLPWPLKFLGTLWLLVPVFSIIVSTTDTPKDDKVWGKVIYPLLEILAMSFLKAKQKPGDVQPSTKMPPDDQEWL